jgi:hypothetical protein
MVRDLAIRLVTSVSWRRSSARLAASLNRFSQVEADSGWQMLRALTVVESPEFRVKLFSNALEEIHHAALFRSAASRHASAPLPLTSHRRHAVFAPERGLAWFEAFHYVGEHDVYHQFHTYAMATADTELRRTFLEIRGDEAEHQKLAYAELCRLAGSRRKAQRLICSVRARRLRERCLRGARSVGDLWSSLVLTAIYYISGPFLRAASRRHLG